MNYLKSMIGLAGLLALVVFSANSSMAKEVEEDLARDCFSSREFITAHQYLTKRRDLGLAPKHIEKLAHKVSLGCTGSAKRFIYSLEVLLKAEANPRGALQAAVDLSQKSQSYTHTFLGVFTRSYLRSELDMDFNSAFRLAQSLSTDYDGDVKMALDDFRDLAKYCIKEKDISLSKHQCGLLAGRVAKLGVHSDMPVAESFIKAYEFAVSSRGPEMNMNAALNMAENIVRVSPEAVTNFIQAYRYGVSKKGMKLDKVPALKLAQTLTNRTVHDPKVALKIDFSRFPASLKKSKKDSK